MNSPRQSKSVPKRAPTNASAALSSRSGRSAHQHSARKAASGDAPDPVEHLRPRLLRQVPSPVAPALWGSDCSKARHSSPCVLKCVPSPSNSSHNNSSCPCCNGVSPPKVAAMCYAVHVLRTVRTLQDRAPARQIAALARHRCYRLSKFERAATQRQACPVATVRAKHGMQRFGTAESKPCNTSLRRCIRRSAPSLFFRSSTCWSRPIKKPRDKWYRNAAWALFHSKIVRWPPR